MKQLACWIEAMRLRTLPVSVAGVILAAGCGFAFGSFNLVPALLCLLFAVLAQIASNFANEYYDFKGGLDRPGREGPRRGVTEGDISPEAMRNATFLTLGLACAVGCSLIIWSGWWLVLVGALVAVGVLAYSTGPYPLSHHALGEVAVVFFFGIIPVTFTYYLMAAGWNLYVSLASVSAGLLGANVLIINNYRDMEDDAAVGKNTSVVKFGRTAMSVCYLLNAFLAVGLMVPLWSASAGRLIVPAIFLGLYTVVWNAMRSRRGASLNPFLGLTAIMMLLYSVAYTVCAILS